MTRFAALFSPFQLGAVCLSNRIVMAPMTRTFSPGRRPGADVAAYYRARAQGGVGLIITEGTSLSTPASSYGPAVPKIDAATVEAWRAVTEDVHRAGGTIFCQIWHVGAIRRPEKSDAPNVPSQSPSGLFKPDRAQGAPMSLEEIDRLVAAYAASAAAARSAGFDGIELHGAHGYLIDQFFWSGTNRRRDQYGGATAAARTRFACDLIRAARRATAPDFPILIRFSQWKQQDYAARLASTPEELEAFLTPMAAVGVDAFHCSTRRFWEPEFDGSALNLAGWAKKLTGKPTITVGSIGLDTDFISTYGPQARAAPARERLDQLDAALAKGDFDLAAIGRALIANPDWPQHVRRQNWSALRPYDKEMLASLT